MSKLNLKPLTPLGGLEPSSETIGSVTVTENVSFSFASLAMRNGKDTAFDAAAKKLFKCALPEIQSSAKQGDWQVFWSAPDQYFVSAPINTHEDIAAILTSEFKDSASITEQTSGWVRFDIEGVDCVKLLQHLCATDAASLENNMAVRTVMEHLGVFLHCRRNAVQFSIYGASSSAQSLHHAVITAAMSIK